jgi:hypothetical protein
MTDNPADHETARQQLAEEFFRAGKGAKLAAVGRKGGPPLPRYQKLSKRRPAPKKPG